MILTPLAALPPAPGKTRLDDFCASYRIKPISPAGRLAADRGWIVTSEARLGPYQTVSFAGSFEPGTSGVCAAHDGNIAIFDGTTLVALAYGAKSAKQTLGTVESIESGGLLIQDGEGPGVPVGELHMLDGGLSISRLAAVHPVCAGRAIVPNVYGLDIRKGRKVLLAHGWTPDRPKDAPGEFDQAAVFAKEGIIEAVSCSGTGYGFCSFDYRHGTNHLSVTTLGESYTMFRYEAQCR